jgi:hypothetical protein
MLERELGLPIAAALAEELVAESGLPRPHA